MPNKFLFHFLKLCFKILLATEIALFYSLFCFVHGTGDPCLFFYIHNGLKSIKKIGNTNGTRSTGDASPSYRCNGTNNVTKKGSVWGKGPVIEMLTHRKLLSIFVFNGYLMRTAMLHLTHFRLLNNCFNRLGL